MTTNQIIIPNQTEIKTFNQADKSRWYRRVSEPDSMLRPSVTTILDLIVPPTLKNWFIKTSAADIQKRKTETAHTGTNFHLRQESRARGVEVPEEGLDRAWHELVDQYEIEQVHTEIKVVSDDYGFGGSCDGIFHMKDKAGVKRYFVGDFKTGWVNPRCAEQIAAYRVALQKDVDIELGLVIFSVHRDGRKPMAIFYNDPDYWFTGFIGAFENWKMEHYGKILKPLQWHWINDRPLYVLKPGEIDAARSIQKKASSAA